jgi:LPS sulfotransferase NodH
MEGDVPRAPEGTRAERAKATRPSTSYLICSLPRTGSWLLSFGLEDTGLAGHPYPFFCPRVMDYCAATYSLPSPAPVRDYIDVIAEQSLTPNGVFGAKIEWFDLENLFALVRDEWGLDPSGDERATLEDLLGDVRVIYLERRDKVREAVSFGRALETRQWAQPADDGAARPAAGPDFARLDELFDLLIDEDTKWKQFFSRNGYEPLTVTYEDYSASAGSFAATIREVLDYLGVAVPAGFEPPGPRQQRQSDESSEDAVRRYREHREHREHLAALAQRS